MKKFYLFITLVLSSFLNAGDSVQPPTKKEMVPILPHVWLSGEFLLLKAQENRLAFANQAQQLSASSFLNTSLIRPHFEWNPGVRIDVGWQFKKWTTFLNWMFIQNKADGKKSTDGTRGFFPVLSFTRDLSPNDYVTSAAEFWKLNFNSVEIGGSYPWKFSKYFTLKPHLALKGVSLNQHLLTYYGGGFFDVGVDNIEMKNDFWGVGPAIGLLPNLRLGKGFSLFGDFSTSALLGRFFIQQREKYLTQLLSHHSRFLTRLCWTLDAKVALNWQTEFLYKAIVFGVQVGWEWHKLYDQNHFPQNHFRLFNNNKNLILRGGFLSIALGF